MSEAQTILAMTYESSRREALDADKLYQGIYDIVHSTPSGGFNKSHPQWVWGEYMFAHRETIRAALTAPIPAEIREALEKATDQLEHSVMGGRINTKIVDEILERKALALIDKLNGENK